MRRERSDYQRKYRATHAAALKDARKAWYAKNKTTQRERAKQIRRSDAAEMWAAYGGECVCCGEKETRFFELDHIFRDGYKEKGPRGGPRPDSVAKWRKHRVADRVRFQILCSNCNLAKQRHGHCPHMEGMDS